MKKIVMFSLIWITFLFTGCAITSNNKAINNSPRTYPIKVWEKTFAGKKADKVYAITPTKDGGFIVTGYTEKTFLNKLGNMYLKLRNIYLIKTDKNGNKIWQKTFGGKLDDEAYAITPTKDNGFIIAGYTESFGNGKKDLYVIKINENGNKIWQKTFGGEYKDEAYAITPTKDNRFIIAGYTASFGNGWEDVYLIKIDKDGNKIWQKTFGGRKDDEAYAITPTKNNEFIIAGATSSFNDRWGDIYIIKIDKDGNKIWQKTFGEKKDFDKANAIVSTKNGFIVAGYTSYSEDIYLIKIDVNGNKIWQKTFNRSKSEEAEAIVATKDNGFIIAGYRELPSNNWKSVYLIKIKEKNNSTSNMNKKQ